MKGISITYDPRKLDRRAIESFLSRRIREGSALRWAELVSVIAFFGVIFVMGLFMDEIGTGPFWLLPGFASLLAFEVIRRIACRQLTAKRDAAPIRNRSSTTIQLDETGVLADGMKLNWVEIIDVLRGPRVTLLVLLPEMAIVLPDEALPEGVLPDGLAAQIGEWKSK